jgi:DNA gyrase inhibitor GyrI
MNIAIKELPEYEVAFNRRTGSYFEPQDDHWVNLVKWAVMGFMHQNKVSSEYH